MKKIAIILSTSLLFSFSLFALDDQDEWEELNSVIFNKLQRWNEKLAASSEENKENKENNPYFANHSSPARIVTFGRIETESDNKLAPKQVGNTDFSQFLNSLNAVFKIALELAYDSEQFACVRDFFSDQHIILSKIKDYEFAQVIDTIHFYASGTPYKFSLINILEELSGRNKPIILK